MCVDFCVWVSPAGVGRDRRPLPWSRTAKRSCFGAGAARLCVAAVSLVGSGSRCHGRLDNRPTIVGASWSLSRICWHDGSDYPIKKMATSFKPGKKA